jgi:ABC-type bacteriocin/lantibiotic exporter with double-glycine peptidase domain
MVYFAPMVGIIALILGIGIIWIIFLFDKPYIATLKEVNEKEHTLSSTLFDSLSNIITVITLRLEKRMEAVVMNRVGDIFPPYAKNVRINEWKWFVVDMLVGLIYSLILIGYMYQNYVPGQVFLIGGLVTLMSYVHNFTSVFHNIAWMYTDVVRYDTDVKTALNIIEAYDALEEEKKVEKLPANWQNIEIKDLNFLHHKENEAIQKEKKMGLFDVGIQIKKGQKIAFIGKSGSGKSTLLALLRGLYQPLQCKHPINPILQSEHPCHIFA